MDPIVLMILAAVIIDGIVGLSGGLLPAKFVHRYISYILAFAAGTLLSAAFFDLLPEALLNSAISPQEVMYTTLIGFFVFYLAELFLGSETKTTHHITGPLVLFGDGLHNCADGVAIAAAFLADVRTGIAATLAVLIASRYSKPRALFYRVILQFSILLGALGALWIASATVSGAPYLLAFSAGGFIYLGAVDLLPKLHRNKKGSVTFNAFWFTVGILVIDALEFLHR